MEGTAPERRWYVLRLRSNFEHKAHSSCTGRGLETFLPTYRRASRKHGGPAVVERPLFPGYLFARIDVRLPERNALLLAPGAVELVRFGGRAAPIPDVEIDSLKIVCQPESGVQPLPFLRSGTKVVVVAGPFRGAQGIIEQRAGQRSTFVVTIELLGRSVGVPIEPELLELAP